MGKFLRSCLNGLAFAVKPWVVFGLLLPIIFFAFHPLDPMLVLGLSVIGVVVYYSGKWKKEVPAARKATEEAEKAGAKFVDADPYNEEKESPLKRYKNKFYPAFWTALLSACMLSCSYQYIYDNTRQKSGIATIPAAQPSIDAAVTGRTVDTVDTNACTIWTANNIKMVHLEDASQYVTNSDSILSEATVDSMNTTLQKLDSIAGVKSAIVVCHKVSGSDTYRTAVDLMNKHHIGHIDTGLGICVVVAYDQHRYTIAPSRALESLLTDIECNQLARNCLEPYLKNALPDSAMLCLTEALYTTISTNQAKEPEGFFSLSSFRKKGLFGGSTGTNMLIILLLSMVYGIYDEKNKWTKSAKMMAQASTLPKESKKEDTVEKNEEPRPTPPTDKGGKYGGGESGGAGVTGNW